MSLLRHHNLLIGQFHPFYQAILNKAIVAGYALPSFPCMVLQDRLVRNLVLDSIWNLIDYLHIYADDSGSADMARINWRQTSLGLSTGSPTHVSKKGLYGTISHSWNIVTNKIAMGAGGDIPASQFVWLTENGGTISAVEQMVQVGGGPNARFHTIRLRTNPRVDYLLNTTTAGVGVIYNGFPLDNHFYHIEISNVGGVITATNVINGTITFSNGPVGTGLLPDGGSLVTTGITSTRAVGLIGGGGGIRAASKEDLLYNHFNTYMTAVQLLP